MSEQLEKLKYFNREYQRFYYKENKEKFKAYYQLNRLRRLEYQSKYGLKTSEAMKEYHRDYYQNNTKKKIFKKKGIEQLKNQMKIEKKDIVISWD